MEIKISTQQILKILYVLSWIFFIGVCIEGGAFISNAVLTFTLDPEDAQHLWKHADLSALHQYDPGYFLVQALLMGIVAVLKACMLYLIIKILHGKKLDLYQPFNTAIVRFIFKISYLTLAIGLFSAWGVKYAEWFVSLGVEMPDIEYMLLGGADVWLFMSVVLFVIAQIFKRGIEIQTENELTV